MALIDIDRKTVSSLTADAQGQIYYDRRLTGFGLRVSQNGRISYFVEYRPGVGGRAVSKRRIVVGRESPTFRADQARREAERELAKARLGYDPALERAAVRESVTISDLLSTYTDDRILRLRKARTAEHVRSYNKLYIEPELGSRKVVDVQRNDVVRLHHKIGRRHPTTANRVIETLRAAFAYGQKQGLIAPDVRNPASDFEPYKEVARERFLSSSEFVRLGTTLRLAETVGLPWSLNTEKKLKHCPKEPHRQTIIDPHAIAAIRLLLLTGARLREILHLKWSDVDFERGVAMLLDSKTGRKPLMLGSAALAILTDTPKTSSYVIAGQVGTDTEGRAFDKPRADLNRPWKRVRKHAGLGDVRLHDLRHTFASIGAGQGVGLYAIGQLLNHSSPTTTKRYAHLADDPLRRASDDISRAISAALDAPESAREVAR